MKKFSFIHMMVMLVLVVSLASCGFTQPVYEDEGYSEGNVSRGRIYNDPYYNNNRTRIVRDPYTGQYYEVTPVGPYANTYPVDAYGYPYGTYPSRNRVYTNRSYDRNTYPNNYPRQSQTQSQPRQQQQPVERPAPSRKIEEMRDVINGKN